VDKYRYCIRRSHIRSWQDKEPKRRDIVVYGGASFDSSLIKEKLIDEFYLFINPVAIGNGMTILRDEIQKYSLIESKVFESGKVLLRYEA
jgi:dihydrofolate reductase